MTARTVGRRGWPWLILLIGVAGMFLLLKLRPHPQRRAAVVPQPLVRTLVVPDTVPRIVISEYGTVRSRRHVQIVPQVSGTVVRTSPRLQAGDVLAAGDTLLVIDPVDYELAVRTAAAQVARAEVALARERHEAAVARQQWERIHGDDGTPPDPLVLHEPQLHQAEADLAAAQAGLEQARINLRRCVIRAPFDCRIADENVDEGQYVRAGTVLGSLYELAEAEVTVPLPDGDLAFFRVPSCPGDTAAARAVVTSDFGGHVHHWPGRIDRTGGVVDPATRLVDVVVRIENPFHTGDDRPPLLDGTFVTVHILGDTVPGAAALPRAALRPGDTVWTVDDSSRVHIRPVAVVHRGRETVVVRGDLPAGTRVIVSQLDIVTEGMRVRTAPADGGSRRSRPGRDAS